MKLNMFLKPFLLILALAFSFSASAEISRQSDINLERKNFTAAQVSLSNDLEADRYDAKTWYFYSRTLYQLNESSAAKQALNNAMNIDKTGSFAKGGMSNVRDFAQSIMQKSNNTRDPKKIVVEQLKSSEYHAYLDQLLGPNKYGNENPPPASVIAKAKQMKSKVLVNNSTNTENKITDSVSMNKDLTSVSKPASANITDARVATNDESGKKVGYMAVIIFILISLVAIVVFIRKNQVRKQNEFRKKIERKNKATEFFNQFKALSDKIGERLADLKAIAFNSSLYQSVSELYDLSLSTLTKLNTNEIKSSDEIIFKEIHKQFLLLNDYYEKNDFDLSLFREDQRKIAKEKEEREKRDRELRKQREAEEAVRREKRRLQEEKERAEREERRKKQQSHSSNHNNNSTGSSSDGLLTGVIIGNILSNQNNNSSSRSRSSDDDNDSLFGSSRSYGRSSDSNNSSLWGSSSSRSGSDSNDSIWGGGSSGSGGSSDNSSDW